MVAALLAIAMGLQNTAARQLAVPDLTTTVLTMTLTGIAADIRGGGSATIARRVLAVLTMFAGALVGALLVVHAPLAVGAGPGGGPARGGRAGRFPAQQAYRAVASPTGPRRRVFAAPGRRGRVIADALAGGVR